MHIIKFNDIWEQKLFPLLIVRGWKYRKGGENIVTIFSPQGEDIVGVKISSHTGLISMGTLGKKFIEILSRFIIFHSSKWVWKYCLRNGCHFCPGGDELSKCPQDCSVYGTWYSWKWVADLIWILGFWYSSLKNSQHWPILLWVNCDV